MMEKKNEAQKRKKTFFKKSRLVSEIRKSIKQLTSAEPTLYEKEMIQQWDNFSNLPKIDPLFLRYWLSNKGNTPLPKRT